MLTCQLDINSLEIILKILSKKVILITINKRKRFMITMEVQEKNYFVNILNQMKRKIFVLKKK